jgi:hypothetical protein
MDPFRFQPIDTLAYYFPRQFFTSWYFHKAVLWIRIGFNANPIRIQRAKPMRIRIQTNADPDPNPGQTLKEQKVEFLHEKYTEISNRSKKPKAFFKGSKPSLFVNLGQFTCSWIRNRSRILNTDPGRPYDCGSMLIRIHNTVTKAS